MTEYKIKPPSINLENRKGTACPYSKEFKYCQEEPCGGCQVWLEWLKMQTSEPQRMERGNGFNA